MNTQLSGPVMVGLIMVFVVVSTVMLIAQRKKKWTFFKFLGLVLTIWGWVWLAIMRYCTIFPGTMTQSLFLTLVYTYVFIPMAIIALLPFNNPLPQK